MFKIFGLITSDSMFTVLLLKRISEAYVDEQRFYSDELYRYYHKQKCVLQNMFHVETVVSEQNIEIQNILISNNTSRMWKFLVKKLIRSANF